MSGQMEVLRCYGDSYVFELVNYDRHTNRNAMIMVFEKLCHSLKREVLNSC